jgi:hypothetical protein
MRLLPLALVAALTCAAPALAADYPQGTEDFAVFAQPVDTSHDQSLGACPEGYAWDGPKPDSPCFAPMRGNSRFVALPDGMTVAIAPIGRWICIAWGRLSLCRTQKQALAGRLALYDSDYVIQIVPNWVSTVRIGEETVRAEHNVVYAKAPFAALAYAQRAVRGEQRKEFAPRMPDQARKVKVFRMPLSYPRRLGVADQVLLSRYYAGSWIEAMPRLARRFGGSDFVAVPGRLGFDIVDLRVISEPEYPVGLGFAGGSYYETAADGTYIRGTMGCLPPGPSLQCDSGTTHFEFLHLVPDGMRSERIHGELYAPIDGLVYGEADVIEGEPDPFGEIADNVKRWTARRG